MSSYRPQSAGKIIDDRCLALATVFHETAGTMQRVIEKLNYSGARLAEVWPSRQATTSRKVVHCRMNQLVDRVDHLEASAITIGDEVSEMKLVIDDVRRWKLRHRWLGVAMDKPISPG